MDLSSLLSLLPGHIGTPVAIAIIVCNLVTVTVKPPASGSRWAVPYRLISAVALNIGWATNRIEAGRSTTPPKK